MKRYRLEIFARSDLSFVTFAESSEPDIYIDSLVSSQSKISCPGLVTCSRGDFAQIRIDGHVYFQGIVSDWNYDGKATKFTLQQMSALLDTEAFADVSLLSNQSIEQWFSTVLGSVFNGTDASEKLPGFTVTYTTSTTGSYEESSDGAYNLYDMSVSFFKVYGLILDISFDYSSKAVAFAFSTVGGTVTKLDLSVSDVLEYEIEPSLKRDSPNKMVIRDKDDPTSELTYYWHPSDFSGTIDTDGTYNRVVPVITQCATVSVGEEETFSDVAYAKAEDVLYQTRYDDLIQVTIRANSKLLNNFEIGKQYTLYDHGDEYNTLLTGIHTASMNSIELTFGYIRKRLTEILKMKGV